MRVSHYRACAQCKAGESHAVFRSLFFFYVGNERRAGSKCIGCHSMDHVYLTLHHPGKTFWYRVREELIYINAILNYFYL